jgi:predicted ATPase/Tfp pilus assembly protein PilF/DNA-binding XRE family transcriptional regulator
MDTAGLPSFASLLKTYRLARGLSQGALADRAGLSQDAISLLERGLRLSPRDDTVTLLAKALNLGADERACLQIAASARRERPAVSTCADSQSSSSPRPRLSSFVGRERELAEVRELVLSTRLLTLSGAGGVGKTSLALVVASAIQEQFTDGVVVVELATLVDEELVPRAIAAALGVQEQPNQSLLTTLVTTLRPRQRLLVLDNCEHLLEGCARLVEALLEACPRLRILATSREPLRMRAEVVWRVPSLTLPDDDAQLPDALARSEAVRLFVERARSVRAGFALTAENATAVADICRRLDGIPLAIELAAARASALLPGQIARRLDDRFRLLTTGGRTALPRHQTLQALIDWSHGLLSERERCLFRRLAVFTGGFTLEAAEAVCGFSGLGEVEVLDVLAQLVDKSLVLVEESDQTARFSTLETIRAYAQDKLGASGEVTDLANRHAAYYRALAARLSDQLVVSHDYVRGGFTIDLDNFRAALRWFSDASDWDGCLDLIGSLSEFWHDTGHLGESAPWQVLALQHVQDAPTATRVRALTGLGTLAYSGRDYATAESVLAESLRLSRERSDERAAARALTLLGTTLEEQGKYAVARPVFDEALRLAESLGDRGMALRVRFLFGLLAQHQGTLDEARALLAEALVQARQLGSASYHEGVILLNLGVVAMKERDFTQARALYAECIPVLQQSGYRWALLLVVEMFAVLSAQQGNSSRGILLAGAAAAARDEVGSPIPLHGEAMMGQVLERARRELGQAAEGAWARGWTMTLEQALTYAVCDEDPDEQRAP